TVNLHEVPSVRSMVTNSLMKYPQMNAHRRSTTHLMGVVCWQPIDLSALCLTAFKWVPAVL
ncbi:MAG: hypothetical protein M3319_09420, partial [Actinomycetota bacterium]|nr:hypothetical protein [Actinomycetota bacterium]